MFGSRKQKRDLQVQLLAIELLLGETYSMLPPAKQQEVRAKAPRDIADAVGKVVAAGDSASARELLDASAAKVPSALTSEEWTTILAPVYGLLA
jgi:hypothetical protein